ncbi:MAG: exonuclease domain-containing protein [Burkholderiaceae bacterium]
MQLPAIASRLAFVDVETTGSSPARERVTEIGLVRVDFDNDAVRVDEWCTLVNPGVPIPAEIQWLTGITNEMVRSAPSFADIAQSLFDRLEGALFVAHNARFDYGFVRAEFGRAGVAFNAKTLCTVRLSRYLYPDRAPHTLDAIIERFGLFGEQRHRALGDARVLWRLVQKLADRHAPSEIEQAVRALLRRPSLPSHLPVDAIDSLPHAPGVYLFYGLNEHPIYVGKSVDLRARVSSHFRAEHLAARGLRLSQEIHRLEWEETAGELGALLRESVLIKTRLPAHNVASRRKLNQVLLSFREGRAAVTRADALDPVQLGHCYGPFSSRASVRRWLVDLAAEHQLCLKTMGLEGRRKAARDGAPCFNHQLHRCRGACVGSEREDEHAGRLAEVIRHWLLPVWPYAHPIALIEENVDRFQQQWHVFDQWCWLGSVKSFAAAAELAQQAPRTFEADAARLCVQALSGRSAWTFTLVELPAVRFDRLRLDCSRATVAAG